MNTPRTIRLVRADGLPALHGALSSLACGGTLAEVRSRVVLVPSRAAAYLLRQTLEDLRLRDVTAPTMRRSRFLTS